MPRTKKSPAEVKPSKKEIQAPFPADLISFKASDRLLAQYVRVYLANQRQGTKAAKTRGDVVGSTRKIYKQKGTGRARHGSRKAALFVGGGVTHGPLPTDYSLSMTKKQKERAFWYALAKRYEEGAIFILDGLLTTQPKTKEMAAILKRDDHHKSSSVLLIYPKNSENLIKASRNIPNMHLRSVDVLNTYDILSNRKILFTKEALDTVVKKFEAQRT